MHADMAAECLCEDNLVVGATNVAYITCAIAYAVTEIAYTITTYCDKGTSHGQSQ